MKSLINGKVLRVGAVVRQSGHDRHVAMGVAVHVSTRREHVEQRIGSLDEVIFLAGTIGHADLLMTVRAFSVAQLADTLDRIRLIDGIEDVTCWTHLEVVKEAYGAQFAH